MFLNNCYIRALVKTDNEYFIFFKRLFWPKHSLKLKALVVASVLCVGLGLIVNLYVPIYTQIIGNLKYF